MNGGALTKVMAGTLLAAAIGCRHRSEADMSRSGGVEDQSSVVATRPARDGATRPVLHASVEPLGESVKGRPLELRRFGDPAARSRVLILGGIHGDEVTSVDLARNLIELLTADGSKTDRRHVAIRAMANPDGYAAKTRYNASGVDLNRNFPASNFRTSARSRNG